MYVYLKSEPQLWTVGFYSPDGKWNPESDHGTPEQAAARVHYLNGGRDESKEYNHLDPLQNPYLNAK